MDLSESPPSYHYRKWLVLLGSVLLQISLGSMFVFGNFTPYLASYMSHAQTVLSKQQLGFNGLPMDVNALYVFYLFDCNWAFATCFIVFTLSSLLGGHIQQQIGVKTTLVLSSVFMCIGTLLCYFTLVNIYAFIFCYLLFGCGAGIAYPIPFVSCLAWFKKDNQNNYYIIVLLNSCFACSSFIFAPLQLALINPNNIPIDPDYGVIRHHDIMQRIPLMYIYLTLIIAILQLIAILLISNPSLQSKCKSLCKPHDISSTMNVAVPPHSCKCHQKRKCIAYNSMYDISYKEDAAFYQMMKLEIILNGRFWQLWMIHFCSMIVYLFMVLVWKIFATQYLGIYDDQYLTTICAGGFALNGIFRFIWNAFYTSTKRVKNKKMVLLMIHIILCVFVASLSIPFSLHSPLKETLYALWILIIFCVAGSDWIIYPPLIAITFGQRHSGHVVGYCCTADILAMLILGAFHLYGMNTDSWQGFTWIIAAFLVFSIILIIVFDPNKVIAERQLKDTLKSFKNTSYNSISSPAPQHIDHKVDQCSKGCGCGSSCECCHE
eukprot:76623_1